MRLWEKAPGVSICVSQCPPPLVTYLIDLIAFPWESEKEDTYLHIDSGGDLAQSLGGRKIFSRTKISKWRLFREKISIVAAKISDDFFLVIDQVFRIFPFFCQIFRIFTMLNVVYDPFLTIKTHVSETNSFMTPSFFTLFVLSRASDNTTSQNIGRDGCMGRPHLKFGWDRPPAPLGLRPCTCTAATETYYMKGYFNLEEETIKVKIWAAKSASEQRAPLSSRGLEGVL